MRAELKRLLRFLLIIVKTVKPIRATPSAIIIAMAQPGTAPVDLSVEL